jgi:hypothetical protein
MSEWVVIKLEHQVGRWVWFAVSITAESSVRKSNSSPRRYARTGRLCVERVVAFAWNRRSSSVEYASSAPLVLGQSHEAFSHRGRRAGRCQQVAKGITRPSGSTAPTNTA